MAKYTKKQAIEIYQERKTILQSQLDNRVSLLSDPEKQFAHFHKEIAKCDKIIASLKS
jgi:hypothetical protein